MRGHVEAYTTEEGGRWTAPILPVRSAINTILRDWGGGGVDALRLRSEDGTLYTFRRMSAQRLTAHLQRKALAVGRGLATHGAACVRSLEPGALTRYDPPHWSIGSNAGFD
jgi:hypothetical protein